MTCSKLTKLLLGSQKSHILVVLESPIARPVGLQGLPLVAIACEQQVLFSPIASQTIISGENVDLVDGRSRRLLLGREPKLGFNCRGNLCKRNTNIDKSSGSRSRIRKKVTWVVWNDILWQERCGGMISSLISVPFHL